MTDTNKERERYVAITREFRDRLAWLGDQNHGISANDAKQLREAPFTTLLGDRVGQTFTGEGFREWDLARPDDLESNKSWYQLAAEYAATLQPQQTMGRAMTEAEALKWIEAWAELADKPYEGHWEDLAYWLTTELDERDAKKLSAPSHPVEGELTRDALKDMDTFAERLGKAGWEGVHDAQWHGADSFRQDIVNLIAATEARVREECEAEFQEREDAALVKGIHEVEILRTTIANLTKELEGAVKIPPVSEWTEWATGIQSRFTAAIDGHGRHTASTGLLTGDGTDRWAELAYIPRPTPKTLTNEEKVEVVLVWYMKFNQVTREVAKDVLIEALSDGKSIDELYAEVKGE